MAVLTNLERELILKIFKDFSKDYNSSTISKEVGKTRMGAFKALQSLENKGIVNGRTLGRARFYKLNLNNQYAKKTVELLLMEEAKQYPRWVDEFKEIFEHLDIAVLFGSIIKNEKKAKDIDLMLIYPRNKNEIVNGFIKEKNQLLFKKIHPLKQTKKDLKKNLEKRDKVILDAIRTGVVLFGFQELVELIAKVTSQK